ncbi:hypothetical protein SAMN05192552_10218 [Natrinema hispanicum]|uniref:Uncharacterized protein n=1 Tax=Natrinema hispanicum TaxID=392421 RepID=A0A1I0IJ09_9EURY|nr:hypothetical protein SAMN05192552_10218 [Natrinema hispanicum]SET96699.1 hypothetical protein SAMN04488694_12113 [Natrinema hispanicum]
MNGRIGLGTEETRAIAGTPFDESVGSIDPLWNASVDEETDRTVTSFVLARNV